MKMPTLHRLKIRGKLDLTGRFSNMSYRVDMAPVIRSSKRKHRSPALFEWLSTDDALGIQATENHTFEAMPATHPLLFAEFAQRTVEYWQQGRGMSGERSSTKLTPNRCT